MNSPVSLDHGLNKIILGIESTQLRQAKERVRRRRRGNMRTLACLVISIVAAMGICAFLLFVFERLSS